ncbi:hypothetical protein SAMN05444266_104508 [Chitinophaga jiangningensis]|uniref:Uncharacterized protein n=1 Tax=Chitinophaga jiangningensis TaxID=1419482 RepID=A0A1M7CWP1_9BACT|nr:hypothetical protein [Chitinophaga jiangningensis]SHL71666.1 hypothetical protein SAMN05444266_104508 [Chitinophaga jiangningensis]
MEKLDELPEYTDNFPPGYLAYRAEQLEMKEKLRLIEIFCQELLNDKQKAKEAFIKIGVLQSNGKTTWPYRHWRFPTLED